MPAFNGIDGDVYSLAYEQLVIGYVVANGPAGCVTWVWGNDMLCTDQTAWQLKTSKSLVFLTLPSSLQV